MTERRGVFETPEERAATRGVSEGDCLTSESTHDGRQNTTPIPTCNKNLESLFGRMVRPTPSRRYLPPASLIGRIFMLRYST